MDTGSSTPSNRRDHWQAVYTNKADAELSWFQDRPSSSLALIR